MTGHGFVRVLSFLICFGVAAVSNAQSITFIGSTTGSDYSDTGLDLGNEGFWFAQFAAQSPIADAAVDDNHRNSLPSWVLPDFTVDETFSGSASSKGGQTPWAMLILPDGETGLSGALVDSNTAGNSNNTISSLALGPGTPSQFYLHVVTDNTAGQHDPAGRLRARAEKDGVFDISGPNTPAGLADNMDGSPDVYTWLYQGVTNGSIIKLQLNSGNGFETASIAGIMFDRVPEPTSGVLLLLAALSCGVVRMRR